MLKAKIDCIYSSLADKKQINFSCTVEVVGEHLDFLDSHLKNRYLPMKIRENRKLPHLARIVSFRVSDYEIVPGDCYLHGMDILKMTEFQIQELARYFNLLEIPLPYTVSLPELREKAALAYYKNVLNFPLDKDDDKEKFEFMEKTDSGWRTNFKDKACKVDTTLLKTTPKVVGNKKMTLEEAIATYANTADNQSPDILSEQDLIG